VVKQHDGRRKRCEGEEEEEEGSVWLRREEEEQEKAYFVFLISTIYFLCATCHTSKQSTGKLEEITTGADPNSN